MASRIREKPDHLFEVFVEIAKPEGPNEMPFIIQQYPSDYDDKEALVMIPKFAYPCITDAQQVDHFTFVLTDLDSMFRFGYCRHATGHQTCLCIVSWLPWCEIFYKLLDLLAEITNRADSNVTKFLEATYKHEVPLSKVPVTIVAQEDMFSFTAPDPNVLPSIPRSRNLTEYYNAVDPSNMMLIFASMLHERRIYMTSKKLSRLTSCLHAAEALLYPMHWQHLYIPVLPAHLIDYVSAPMPYLIGVHSNLLEKLKINRVDVGDAVIVDLDANTVTTEYDDLGDLPEDVSSYLKRNLKPEVVKNSMARTGDAISIAFLQTLIRLIGGYRDALKFRLGEPITFDPEAFVHSRSSQTTQAFLEGMLTLQIFQQFIYGRLEILNAGIGFRDIFEQQASIYADKLNSQSKYKEWLKSFKKSSKKGWNGLKVKAIVHYKQAAPMMSTAVHSMKEQGKKAMADFKTKISVLTDSEDKKGSNFYTGTGVVHTKARPVTTSSSSLRTNRPPRPPPPKSGSIKSEMLRPKSVRQSVADDVHDDSQLRLSYQTVDVDLMGDLEIQAAIFRSPSADMLPNRREVSSTSGSSSSSGSLEGIDSSTIPFGALHSSDEGINIGTASEGSLQDIRSSDTGDRLIRTQSNTSSPGGLSLASPRSKKSSVSSLEASTSTNWPKPLPRQSSLCKTQPDTQLTHNTVQDAPLIKFDSSESEPTDSDNFDPLAPKSTPAETPEPLLDLGPGENEHIKEDEVMDGNEPRGFQRNTGPRVSLTRSEAFRRSDTVPPLRHGVRDDTPERDANEVFDPLSDITDLKVSNSPQVSSAVSATTGNAHPVRADPLSSHSPRRDSSDLLMHEWSLASLAKGPNVTLPSGQSLRLSYPTNPFLNPHLRGRPVNQSLPSAFSSTLSRTGSPNQSRALLGQGRLPPGAYLSQQRSSFQQFNTPASQFTRQSMPVSFYSKSPSPIPGKLSASSFVPYSRPQSSTTTPQTMNFPTPVASSTSPFIHSPSRHVQASAVPPDKTGPAAVSTPSSSNSTKSQNQQSDIFTDLMDIDFGGGTSQQALPPPTMSQPQQEETEPKPPPPTQSPQPPPPPQPKWETFD